MRRVNFMAVAWLVGLWLVIGAADHVRGDGDTPLPEPVVDPRPLPSRDQIDHAVAAMKAYLYKQQDQDTGSWDRQVHRSPHHAGGITALVVTALLQSGESYQQPRIAKAIDHLVALDMRGTYAVAMRAHVWAHLPETFAARLTRDAFWLLDAHDGQARFRYQPRPTDFDHSATQFGVLGLWEAAKRGFEVPEMFWQLAMKHFMNVQNFDGGWGYRPNEPSKGSMTAAGLTVLLIAREQLYRDAMAPPPRLTLAIDQATGWLDQYFDPDRNPTADGQDAGREFYYLYSVERVALASGLRFFNHQDWYLTGARHILDRMDRNPRSLTFGGIDDSAIQTAFALMFLTRSRAATWLSKLTIDNHHTNDRPDDIKQLTRWLSDLRETTLGWQLVSLDDPVESWLGPPVTFLTCDQALTLTEVQRDNLKAMLDRGGLLVASGQNGSQAFADSVRELGRTMYPRRDFKPVSDDHPIFHTLFPIRNPGDHKLEHLSNGVRSLIILTDRDWSFDLQSQSPDQHTACWQLMANLVIHATGRGRLTEPDAATPQPKPPGNENLSDRKLIVVRVRHDGNWLPEPAVWQVMAEHLRARSGLALDVRDVDIEQLGAAQPGLAHLVGTEAMTLTPKMSRAIEQYVHRGGTILVENIGGQSQFAASLEPQLDALFKIGTVQLAGDDAMINGQGLVNGYDVSHVDFRRYTQLKWDPPHRPRLSTYRIDQRPAVIISREDLSMGLLNIQHWGILGYSPRSAKRLMSNLVLWIAASAQR